jgi:hypothetical protein
VQHPISAAHDAAGMSYRFIVGLQYFNAVSTFSKFNFPLPDVTEHNNAYFASRVAFDNLTKQM